MARWDEILSLPVQNPPSLEFSAADLVWSKIEGWRDNIDRLALIPFARVDDFVRGESANKDCPTRFHVEARRRRPPESSCKKKVDGILEYILYWCSFGPDDHRKGGIVRPSRNTYVPKKKNAGRPNTKRGCTCHFIVKRLIAEPSVALIIYNQDKHVDKKGLPCHGPQDKKAEGTRAMFAPYISEDLRLRVYSLLYVGVSVETIMQKHSETVEKQGGPTNRDDLLTHRYVRRQERSIRRSTYELDADDAISLSLWVESHQSYVFFYEDFSDSDPFTLAIQTEWQLQQMIRFGNCGILASDSRFGTNKLKYPVHSIIVFNSDNKAIPVAWIITPRFSSAVAHKWMRALHNRVRTKDPSWKLAGFIVDDPLADILTIRDVFQCSVLISFWRVRHAWHKNLVKRCLATEMRVEMSKRLGQAVEAICRGNGNVSLFDDFMEDFVDCSDFVDYFKASWYPKIGTWVSALKTLPLASHETCAAIEFYHNQLKVRLLNERDPSVYQRTDWLVDKLGTKVHSYFWLDEYSEKDVFARYWKDEWASGLTAWRKALKIPDTDVIIEDRIAKVIDRLDRDRVHVVWNPGSEYAICDCSWAEMGNLCEHVFKVIRMCREKGSRNSSISLLKYKQALLDMLHWPRHDSLIRDHAISLAVAVQKQLDALVCSDSGRTLDSIQKHGGTTHTWSMVGVEAANKDRALVNKNTVSSNEDNCADARNSSVADRDNSDRILREDNSCADTMNCPASISDSPPRSHSSNKVDISLDNRDKATECADTSENSPSKDEKLTAQVGIQQDEAMEIEQPPAATPMPTMESSEQHSINKQDISCDSCCPVPSSVADKDHSYQVLREDNSCADTMTDHPSISDSPPRSRSSDNVDISLVNSDKATDCGDTSENSPSKDEKSTAQIDIQQDEAMEIEQPTAATPMPIMESSEQHAINKQDSSCDNCPDPSSVADKDNSYRVLREDNSCADMTNDPPSISDSPSRLRSVDKVDVSLDNIDKAMDCADTSENSTSMDEKSTAQVGIQQPEAMEIEQQPTATTMPVMESSEQHTINKQDISCDNFPVPSSENTGAQFNKISTSISEAVDTEMIDVVETPGMATEDTATETEAGNKNGTENHSTSDNPSAVNEGDDNNTDMSDLHRADEAVESIPNSESSPIISSTPSQIDEEHPAEVSGTETGSSNTKTLTKEVVLATSSPQKDSATKTNTNEISSQPESDSSTIAT